jgi:hypothetical protein
MTLLAQLKALTMLYRPPRMQRSNPDINIEYSSAIKQKLVEKSKLWQTNRVMKNKLNRAIKT